MHTPQTKSTCLLCYYVISVWEYGPNQLVKKPFERYKCARNCKLTFDVYSCRDCEVKECAL